MGCKDKKRNTETAAEERHYTMVAFRFTSTNSARNAMSGLMPPSPSTRCARAVSCRQSGNFGMRGHIVCICMILFIRNPFAQTINVSGTVTGATGLTQSGATVVLVKKNITTTTAADGTYLISSGSGIINQPAVRGEGFSIVNNVLTIRTDRQVLLSIALFDFAGKQISQIYKGLCTPPVFELPIDQRCRSMQSAVLVVNLDGRTTTVRIMRGMNLLVPGVINKQSTGLTKSAAPAQKNLTLSMLDTLKVTQGTSTIRLFVYNWIDTMDFLLGESDLYSEARQQGVHRINTYRSSLGLSAQDVVLPGP